MGSSLYTPYRLMIGLILPTWFLSMWISDTAATSMMIPIIQAVVHTLEDVHKHVGKYLQCITSEELPNTSFK